MKTILIILDNEYNPDPRVQKHVNCLLNDLECEVHLVCTKTNKIIEDQNHDRLSIYRILDQEKLFQYYKNRFEEEIERVANIISKNKIKHILANDHACLEFSVKLKRKYEHINIIYDAHEFIIGWPYYQYEKKWFNYLKGALVHKIFCFKEKTNIKQTSFLITVSEGLKKEYLKLFPKIKSQVIRNIPPTFQNNQTSTIDYREKIGINKHQKILIHSGNLYYKDYILDYLLNSISSFKKNWKILFLIKDTDRHRITTNPIYKKCSEKILFHEFVPYTELKNLLSIGTAGLILNYKPEWKSHWYSLPNRIFDYIHADLPVLSTQQPEFEKIVHTYDIGITFNIKKDIKTLTNGFEKIIVDQEFYRKKLEVARKEVTWENEKEKFMQIIKSINNE